MIMLGVVMELSFYRVGGDIVYLYPFLLFAVTIAFLINPLPIFTLQSRKRLLVSLVSTNRYIAETATDTVAVAFDFRRLLSCNMV
jgi:hypothetical protein